jgi:mycoredoxin
MAAILSGRTDSRSGAPGIPPPAPAFYRPERHTLASKGSDHTVTAQITMYSTPWCGYCKRLKGQLDRAGIAYSEVDIEQNPEAASYVESVNQGNQTVPTVVFADGSALTNPSLSQVQAKVAVA